VPGADQARRFPRQRLSERRALSSDYFVVNPLVVVDCIDRKASQLTWNQIDPSFISGILSLRLLDGVIAAPLQLCRPKGTTSLVLMRKALAEEIAARFTGGLFTPIDEFQR
jgi:hypothetical protein